MLIFKSHTNMKQTDPKKYSFAETLSAISGAEPLSDAALKTLNELDEPKLKKFMAAWDGLAPERRAYVAEKLAAQLEDEFELNYDPIFTQIMADPDPRVRLSALEGLQFNSDDSMIDPLIEILRRDPNEEVRAAAAESLGVFMMAGVLGKLSERRNDKVYAALMGVLLTEAETSPVYANALISISCVSNEEVDYRIRSAYKSEDENLRVSAVTAMGVSANDAYEDFVRKELNSPNEDMRSEAATAAGSLEMVDAVPALGKLMEDPLPFVAISAIDALAMIGNPQARKLLENAAESDDEEIAEAAAEALDEMDFLAASGIDFSGSRLN